MSAGHANEPSSRAEWWWIFGIAVASYGLGVYGIHLHDDFDCSHPQGRSWWPAFLLPPGGVIDYECLHDNGIERPVRLDGIGNPMVVRFGISAEDEMCILNVTYYDD
jgi:hypothetical protein